MGIRQVYDGLSGPNRARRLLRGGPAGGGLSAAILAALVSAAERGLLGRRAAPVLEEAAGVLETPVAQGGVMRGRETLTVGRLVGVPVSAVGLVVRLLRVAQTDPPLVAGGVQAL